MPASLENSAVTTGLEKSVFIPIPKKGNAKECSNYCTVTLISYTSKVMVKILQARLQQYMNHDLPYVQAGFRKVRGARSNCQHPLDHQKSKRVPENSEGIAGSYGSFSFLSSYIFLRMCISTQFPLSQWNTAHLKVNFYTKTEPEIS